MTTTWRLIATMLCAVLAAGALGGCGGPPAANAQLTGARDAYEEVASTAEVRHLAPVALYEAREALEEAESAWEQQRDTAQLSHHVFVVRQRLLIARAKAELRAVEEAIREARIMRRETLVKLRTAQAEAAAVAADTASLDEPEAVEPPPRPSTPTEAERPLDPEALGAVLTRRGLVLTLGAEAFTIDGVALESSAMPSLTALVDFLKAYPERRVRIEGFADSTGTRPETLVLSQRRADAVLAALLQRGISAARMSTRAYGAAYPPATGDTPGDHRINNRVEVIISDAEGTIPERE